MSQSDKPDKWEIAYATENAVIVRVFETISAIEVNGFGQLLSEIESLVDPPCVVMDLSNCSWIPSGCISEILRLQLGLKDKNGHLVMCCLSPYTLELFKPLYRCPIAIAETEQDALEWVTSQLGT